MIYIIACVHYIRSYIYRTFYTEREEMVPQSNVHRGIAPWLQRLAEVFLRRIWRSALRKQCSHASECDCSTIPEHTVQNPHFRPIYMTYSFQFTQKSFVDVNCTCTTCQFPLISMAFSVAVYFATSAAVAAQLKRCSASRGALQHEAPIGSRCRDLRHGNGGWRSPRFRAVFARSRALRPKRIPRRGAAKPWKI